jgi:DNA-binding helix-hairpin-helix protein with protein kinase domain
MKIEVMQQVLDAEFNRGYKEGVRDAYARPAQRPWVGLTDEIQAALWEASRAALPRFHTYATLIEKELRILNT